MEAHPGNAPSWGWKEQKRDLLRKVQFRKGVNTAHIITQDNFVYGTRNKRIMSIYSVDAKTVTGRNTHMRARSFHLPGPHHFCKHKSHRLCPSLQLSWKRSPHCLAWSSGDPSLQLTHPTSLKLLTSGAVLLEGGRHAPGSASSLLASQMRYSQHGEKQ